VPIIGGVPYDGPKTTRIVFRDPETGEVIYEIDRGTWSDSGGAVGGFGEYKDSEDNYEKVRVVKVYQKERNKDFLEDGFWKVEVTGWSKEYDPPKEYVDLNPKRFE